MRVLTACVLALLVFVPVVLPGCKGKVSDEERVWAVIKDMADAAEAKDAGRLKGHISKDYSDPAGNDYTAVKGLIAYQFLRTGSISVFLRRHDIKVEGARAHATVRAVISTGKKVSDVEEAERGGAGGFIFDLEFTRDGSDWLLSSAIWRQVGIAEAL
jgi:hypothetical protein